MNCEYCGANLHLSHYENNKETGVYDCTNCPILVTYYFLEANQKTESAALVRTEFMIDRNGRTYIWTNNYVKNNSYIFDLAVSPSIRVLENPLLITFPKIMNINPTNIHQKFSFYMTFL